MSLGQLQAQAQVKAGSFWQGKRVFVTSPTSLLGTWVCLSLQYLGAQVFGFGEASSEAQNLFDISNLAQKISMTYGDIRDEKTLSDALNFAQSDVVLHLGEMGFLFEEDRKSPELIAKSAVGTSLLLEMLRETASVRSVVVVGSDKVYARASSLSSSDSVALNESSPVAAYEILPTARLCAEFIALSYRYSFFNPEKYNKHKVALATSRVGAGIGGGDFNARSFMFEAITSARGGEAMNLRHPQSLRAWVHVLDQVNGLLLLAEKLFERGPKLAPTYNITAVETATVGDVLNKVTDFWKESADRPWGTTEPKSFHGQVDSSLAKADLGWQPHLDVQTALLWTVAWYRAYFAGQVELETSRQLKMYFS